MAWGFCGIGYYISLRIMALGNTSHWVLRHIGCYGMAYYGRVNMALTIMSQCGIWHWVLSHWLILHGVLWF